MGILSVSLLAAVFNQALWAFAPMAVEPPTDTCLQCHGNRAPYQPSKGPVLEAQFAMQWKMLEFTSPVRPPLSPVPKAHTVLRGTTYYDWNAYSMTEIYRDKCIDIFPTGRDFPCQFLSVGKSTYFIQFTDETLAKTDSCCRWQGPEFWAPRPDVIQNMVHDPQATNATDWWILDIPLPGPFGFGILRREPKAFWFPVISGWVQQEFHDYKVGAPPTGAFSLPTACQRTIATCP